MFNYFRNKQRRILRDRWLNPEKWDGDILSIRILFELTLPSSNYAIVDEKTWADLDMDAVFQGIDTSITSVGQQYLYRKLRLLETSSSKLEEDFKVTTLFQQHRDTREELQLCLKMLKQGDAKLVTKALFETFPIASFPKLGIVAWSLLSLSTIFFALKLGGGFLFILLLIVIANFSISRYFEVVSNHTSDILYYLYNLTSVSERIAKLELPFRIPACDALRNHSNSIRRLKKKMKLVAVSQSSESILINNCMYFLNLTFPYDLLIYSISIKAIARERELMKDCYLYIGSIDSSIATASYIERNTHICNPELTNTNEMDFIDTYHPLVKGYISNSFQTKGQSILVTGSNMAGKTTFIKTIGVNVILSLTLWICHATQARIPVLDIFSSIKTEDGLLEGKSFYFSELERLNTFIEKAAQGKKCLFLIDEIYRGTNTVERIAGAAAVLQELASKNLVFVTTHDIELATLLGEQFELWHFEETGDLAKPFDFKIRSGLCRTRNALKLMASMGYPEHITERAKSFAQDLDFEN
jgi:DNA mismatch repair ATPase MutS